MGGLYQNARIVREPQLRAAAALTTAAGRLSEGTSPRSTRLLVSVRDVNEVEAALAGGADIIDIKEPGAGPLGDAGETARREIAAAVRLARPRGDVLVSAALGELAGAGPAEAFAGTAGVALCKLGLAGLRGQSGWMESLDRWQARLAELACGLVPAAYADHEAAAAPQPEEVLTFCVERGLPALLVDTWRKPGPLLERWPEEDLGSFVSRARDAGVAVVLAGSLGMDDLARLAALLPYAIGVRSAACRGGCRDAPVDAGRVARLASALRAARLS